MKTKSGHEDRVWLQQDGVRPGRQMGLSLMLCYSICVCVGGGVGGVPIQSVNYTLTWKTCH